MISKIILKNTGRSNFVLSIAGTLLGFVLLLGSVQLYVDIKSVLNTDTEILSPDYIIINKRLNFLSSLGAGKTDFSEKEIEEIRSKKFIDEAVPFTKNQFKAAVFTPEKHLIPGVYTDIFFESVPDQYIDIKDRRWQWKDEDDKVPVIVPKDYLNLYNFGFSVSQGFPQVPPNMISKLEFFLLINGNGRKLTLNTYILGFSDRINSILVPQSFLNWANKNYGEQEISRPSRLMLVSKEPSNPALHRYIDENGYETNREKLKSSKINTLLRYMLYVLSFISTIIIVLAFYTFVLSFQLIIYRSKEKIETLLLLGYHEKQISRKYNEFFMIIASSVLVVSLISTWLLNSFYISFAEEKGFDISEGIIIPLLIAIGLSLLIFFLNAWFIRRQVRRLC